jgi:hypothetical protein
LPRTGSKGTTIARPAALDVAKLRPDLPLVVRSVKDGVWLPVGGEGAECEEGPPEATFGVGVAEGRGEGR